MRVVFCGSGKLAVPALRAIWASDHTLAAVLTQPSRQAGRGRRLRATPAGEAARELDVSVIECADVNAPESLATLGELSPDVIAVADFGQFIKDPACAIAPHGAFNIHASLLPDLRGSAPINWAILRGYHTTGVTVFALVRKMDAGGIYLQRSVAIKPTDTTEELGIRLAELGAVAACEVLDQMAAGKAVTFAQDESAVTFAPMLTKSDGIIDWSASAETVRNRIHGTWPWPGGQATLHRASGPEIDVVLARADVLDGPGAGQGGTLDDDLCVCTGQDRLRIVEIKPAGRKLMSFDAFANGARLAAGDRFITPKERQ